MKFLDKINNIFKKDSKHRRGYHGRLTRTEISAIKEQLRTKGDRLMYSLYLELPFAKKMVDLPILDLMQVGSQITLNDEENKELNNIDKLINNKLFQALISARLYGNSAMLFILDDDELDKPINEKKLNKDSLKNIILYNNEQITIKELDYSDMANRNFGKPLFYTLNDNWGNVKTVHHSRVYLFTGENDLKKPNISPNELWGESTLKKALFILNQNYDLLKNIGSLVQKALVDVITISDMYEKMCEIENNIFNEVDDPEQIESYAVDRYIDSVKKYLSNDNILILDKENSLERKPYNFAGLHDLANLYIEMLAGIEDIPVERFASKTNASLNNTGGNNENNYGDKIKGLQNHKLVPFYSFKDKLLSVMFGAEVMTILNDPLETSKTEKLAIETTVITNTSTMLANGLVDLKGAKEYMENHDITNLKDIVVVDDLGLDNPEE